MTYNPLIPQPTDLLSNSQPQILTNFGQLNTQFSVDHIGFNTGSSNGDGTHKKITFDNATSPTPTPSGTVSNLYPALVSGEQEVIWKNATHTTQITSGGLPIWKGGTIGTSGVATATTGGNDSVGSLNLPNGIQFRWGNGFLTSGGSVTFTPAFTTFCFNIQITRVNSGTSPVNVVQSFTNTGFTINTSSSGSVRFEYFAIGN